VNETESVATQSPEVAEGLGYTPETRDALMANTKTALNNTFCQRSRHLCVAPTFVVGESALWAIVDLTEGTLVGVRWTTVGKTAGAITEKSLQNDSMMRRYCQTNTALERKWSPPISGVLNGSAMRQSVLLMSVICSRHGSIGLKGCSGTSS